MDKMGKQELADKVAERTGASKADATRMVHSTLDVIEGQLQAGGEVALTGFGKFSVTNRPARMGRNPATGEALAIKASKTAKFTPGSGLKQALAA